MFSRSFIPTRPFRPHLINLLSEREGAHLELEHDGGVPAVVVPEVHDGAVRDEGQQPLVADKMVEGSKRSVVRVNMSIIYLVMIPETDQTEPV